MVSQTAARSIVALLVAALAASALGVALLGAGSAAAAPGAETAKKRKQLTVVNTVRLRLVKRNGPVLIERGTATGTLPGRVKARFRTSLTKVTGTVTFFPRGGGSITMTAVGYPQSAGRIAQLTGNMAVRRGTGRFRGALGSGTFTGTANRKTWAVTVHARANLTY